MTSLYQQISGAILALETSGSSLGVALISCADVIFEENVTEGMIHGRALAPLMDKALRSREFKPSELAAVAVSLGPGSWTGLRIGISAAKTFAWAAGIQLIGVPSFEALALAANATENTGTVLTLRDARSEGFFAAIFNVTAGAPVRLLDECVLKFDQIIETAARIERERGVKLCVCGDEKCLALIADEINARGWKALPEMQHIPARAVARCAARRYLSGEGVLHAAADIHKIGPLYLRASDPELKLNSRV